jgi:uncharacterized protein with PIN domain
VTVRFYLDEDLSPRIAAAVRARGVDAVSSHECGMNGHSDEEQLLFAAREGRCLVTRNRDDFQRLTVDRYRYNARHLGVLIVPRHAKLQSESAIAVALVQYARQRPGDLPPYTLDFLKVSAEAP